MKRVAVIYKLLHARRYLEGLKEVNISNGGYLSWSSKPTSVDEYLTNKGLRKLNGIPVTKEMQERFLREYLLVVDALSGINGHLLDWWATDLASKNRFSSPLVWLLGVFFECASVISDPATKNDPIVIVKPPWPVVCALKKAIGNGEISFQLRGLGLSRRISLWKGKIQTWARIGKGVLTAFLRIWQLGKLFDQAKANTSGNKPLYVIKSFAYSGSFNKDGSFEDPFFGRLSEFLENRSNYRFDVLTITGTFQDRKECWKAMTRSTDKYIAPIEAYLTYGDVINALSKLVKGRLTQPFRVPEKVSFMGWDIFPLLVDCFKSGGWKISFRQYLHYELGERLSRKNDIRACALTFEGNAWERMFIAGIKRNSPNIFIAGYQHAVVPQAGANVFLGMNEAKRSPLPSKIITTGEITKEVMLMYGKFEKDRFVSSCALRYEYLYKQPHSEISANEHEGRFAILVALEGTWDILPLVEYVVDQAPRCQDTRFVLRAHPALHIDTLLSRLNRKIEMQNIIISQGKSLLEDILQTDAVLYWGSTVSMEALMLGKPVVHFESGDFLSCDPLFEFEDFKWVVSKNDKIKAIVDELKNVPAERLSEMRQKGREYIQAYLRPVTEERMMCFLPEGHRIVDN